MGTAGGLHKVSLLAFKTVEVLPSCCLGGVVTLGTRVSWKVGLVLSTSIATCRDFRGPVTKIDVIAGSLLVATGNRLELCTLVVSEAAGDERTYSLRRSGAQELLYSLVQRWISHVMMVVRYRFTCSIL